MTEQDPRYPVPDRSRHAPQQDAKRESYPEIDCARGAVILNDGRPVVVEDWYDAECELFCRTAFYSTLGIEGWANEDHFAILEVNGLLAGKSSTDGGVGHKVIIDASGNPIWSVTVVMREG